MRSDFAVETWCEQPHRHRYPLRVWWWHEPPNAPLAPAMRPRGPATLSAGPLPAFCLIVEPRSAARKGTPMQSANPRRWAALGLIALAQFMVIMDTSIIGVALPEIRTDLGFGAGDLSWVFNAYVIAFGGLLLLGGRLSDLLGARRVFAAGWAILAGASLAAGLAETTGVEIAARAAQGAGAALIAPSALTLLMMLFGAAPKELIRPFAFPGPAAPGGGPAGVFLGGVITEWISWPWGFYITIPIAPLVLAVTPALMPSAPARRGSIDFAGALTATAGLALTVFGIVRAPEEGWGSSATLLAIGGGIALLALFVAVQAARREPLMRLGIF